jgi:hypothetical protein
MENKQRHKWTEQEDESLLEVIESLRSVQDQYPHKKDFWNGVAGGMAHLCGLVVSGNSCRHRWRKIKPVDKWEEVTEIVDAHELMLSGDIEHDLKLLAQLINNHLIDLRLELEAVRVKVDWLAKELGYHEHHEGTT